jgi:predicted PurR-regulated permease PerM
MPLVMNRTVRISPGLMIIAPSTGATLWGLLGALVAIPIVAACGSF